MTTSTKKDTRIANTALESAKGNSKSRKKTAATTDYIVGHEKLVDQVVRRKFVAEEAKRIYDETEAEIIVVAEGVYETRARNDQFDKSVNLGGEEFEGVNVSFSDSFSPIPAESKDTIIDVYVNTGMSPEEATSNFNANFQETRVVKMVDTSNETIALIASLLKFGQLLTSDKADVPTVANCLDKLRSDLRGSLSRGGNLNFGEIFSYATAITPTAGMDERQFFQPEEIRGLLKQKKASTKIKVKVATAAAKDKALNDVCNIIRESTKE